jgi:hypothetical protein
MRVVSTDPASQGPFVVINVADFDPAVHTAYAEPETAAQDSAAAEPKPQRRGRAQATPNT